LGVEGDAATTVEAFARYGWYKDRINKHKEHYKQAQERTMDIIRRELEFKKRPKAERSEEELSEIDQQKYQASAHMEKVKEAVELLNDEFEQMLELNTIEAKGKIFTHVTLQFGDEKVTTKRSHGPSIVSFNQYEIQLSSKFDEEDIGI
ncbi:FapA family protein, partial [Vibrio sp. V29_P1S30P107]|uniref:FapA family protein n=2 Tax=Vibrio TaxID=662 RepID=UPI001372A90D